MNWLKKLKQWTRFRRNDDAYATTREKLWEGIREAVAVQLELGRSVWLVAHFPDTFVQLQELVTQWELEYSIARQTISFESLAGPNQSLVSPNSVHLVLADLMPTYIDHTDNNLTGHVAALMVERHPWMPRDADLHHYFKALSGTGVSVELGYFMAFDDPLVAAVLSETTVEVLTQLGMSSHRLINSMTLSRRIERQLKRQQSQYHCCIDTDNVELWLQANKLEPPS